MKKSDFDPVKLKPFVRELEVRISKLTQSDFINFFFQGQILEGDMKELISSCLHLQPSFGYKEAWHLLNSERSNPYAVCSSFHNKNCSWPVLSFLYNNWRKEVEEHRVSGSNPTFKELVDFVHFAASAASDSVHGRETWGSISQLRSNQSVSHKVAPLERKKLFATAAFSNLKCWSCNQNHSMLKCFDFAARSVEEH